MANPDDRKAERTAPRSMAAPRFSETRTGHIVVSSLWSTAAYALVGIASLFFLFPVYWMVTSSFKADPDVASKTPV